MAFKIQQNTQKVNSMKKIALLIGCAFILLCLSTGTVLANKASVAIEGPVSAEEGSEVTLRLTVTHSANSFFHHIEWLKVQVNGKPFTQWEFTSGNRPEGAVFTREVKIRIIGNTEVVAEASCNIHGSAGPAKVTILANGTGAPVTKTNE
jgi:desulfoferrodoxin (superoxide reductase-like protein)